MARTTVEWVVYVLVLVGAFNWGLVGAFDFNLVSTIFGSVGWLETLIYILVGLSAVWMAFSGNE